MSRGSKWLAAALLLACSPEYELLRTPPASQAGSGAAVGGTDSAGSAAVAGSTAGGVGGADALPVGGESAEGGAATGGSSTGGTATGGTGGNCASQLDCGHGTVCSGSQCVVCVDTPTTCERACDHGFQPVLADYNGCVVCECAPVSECTSSANCAAGEGCYPGAQCAPGCNDPTCCTGNRCGRLGCEGQPIPHCVAAGCAGGAVCLAACSAVSCECDGTSWRCTESSPSGGAPGESCPQACVSP